MYSFDQLVFDTRERDRQDIEKYLTEFFTPEHYDDYLVDSSCNGNEKDAIYEMFHSEGTLLLRALNVLKSEPFCLEANYVNYLLNEEPVTDACFMDIYKRRDEYDSFTDYGKYCYRKLLDLYAQFMLDIHNITFAIKIMNCLVEVEGHYSKDNIVKLSYLYALIEDKDDFYDLYIKEDFDDMVSYLLLMVVLLKHGDQLKAREVLSDFVGRFEYGDYIDHIWDIDSDTSKEAVELRTAVDMCFEEICSIPYFFTWCYENKEKKIRS